MLPDDTTSAGTWKKAFSLGYKYDLNSITTAFLPEDELLFPIVEYGLQYRVTAVRVPKEMQPQEVRGFHRFLLSAHIEQFLRSAGAELPNMSSHSWNLRGVC